MNNRIYEINGSLCCWPCVWWVCVWWVCWYVCDWVLLLGVDLELKPHPLDELLPPLRLPLPPLLASMSPTASNGETRMTELTKIKILPNSGNRSLYKPPINDSLHLVCVPEIPNRCLWALLLCNRFGSLQVFFLWEYTFFFFAVGFYCIFLNYML